MTHRETVDATIAVVPVLNGWRAVIYLDGMAVTMSPAWHDRDVAMLYAKYMENVARDLIARSVGELAGNKGD